MNVTTYDDLIESDIPSFHTMRKAKAKTKEQIFQELWDKGHSAGMLAGQSVNVTPMIVGTSRSLFGSDIDYTKKTYFVEGGVCGFAYACLKPANSAFAKWLKAKGYAHNRYYGGISIYVGEFGQSMTRKEAYASAMADVFCEAGYPAFSESRMD